MTPEAFIQALADRGITLNATQIEQFAKYYALLVEWNERVNLTAITDESEVYLKHFYDSLLPLFDRPDLFEEPCRLCDVGSGAGFPSIPLHIVCPQVSVTIVDALNKRIKFIEELVDQLQLEGVEAVHGRAEDFGQDAQYRAQFDIVTARAVASLNVLCEFCLPFVRKGGHFLAMKGSRWEEELGQARRAIQTLGAKYETTLTHTLPQEGSERATMVIAKTLETPKKYPRRAGKPAKDPIV